MLIFKFYPIPLTFTRYPRALHQSGVIAFENELNKGRVRIHCDPSIMMTHKAEMVVLGCDDPYWNLSHQSSWSHSVRIMKHATVHKTNTVDSFGVALMDKVSQCDELHNGWTWSGVQHYVFYTCTGFIYVKSKSIHNYNHQINTSGDRYVKIHRASRIKSGDVVAFEGSVKTEEGVRGVRVKVYHNGDILMDIQHSEGAFHGCQCLYACVCYHHNARNADESSPRAQTFECQILRS